MSLYSFREYANLRAGQYSGIIVSSVAMATFAFPIPYEE